MKINIAQEIMKTLRARCGIPGRKRKKTSVNSGVVACSLPLSSVQINILKREKLEMLAAIPSIPSLYLSEISAYMN